jgi:hypothetical protein
MTSRWLERSRPVGLWNKASMCLLLLVFDVDEIESRNRFFLSFFSLSLSLSANHRESIELRLVNDGESEHRRISAELNHWSFSSFRIRVRRMSPLHSNEGPVLHWHDPWSVDEMMRCSYIDIELQRWVAILFRLTCLSPSEEEFIGLANSLFSEHDQHLTMLISIVIFCQHAKTYLPSNELFIDQLENTFQLNSLYLRMIKKNNRISLLKMFANW